MDLDFKGSTSCEFSTRKTVSNNINVGPRRGRLSYGNAARERTRVKTLRIAFQDLQKTLPAVPPDTKLSKLDVLVLATTYIAHLMRTLDEENGLPSPYAGPTPLGYLHPIKKWPMRSRLYAGILSSTKCTSQTGKCSCFMAANGHANDYHLHE